MPLHRLLLYAAEVTDGRAVTKAGLRPLGSFLPPKIQESKSLVTLVTFDPRRSILRRSPPEGSGQGISRPSRRRVKAPRRPLRRRGKAAPLQRAGQGAEWPLAGDRGATPAQGAAARPTIGLLSLID